MLVFKCFVCPCFFLNLSCIIKETRCYCFSNIRKIIVINNRNGFIRVINLNSFTKFNQLIFDVPCSLHWSNLHEVLHAPRTWKFTFLPLLEDIQQSDMVTSRSEKVLSSIVSMHYFFLWSKEDCVAGWKHATDCKNLIHAFVGFWLYNCFAKHRVDWEFSHSSPKFCQVSIIIKRSQCVKQFKSSN